MRATKFAAGASGTSWVNPTNILADDGNRATYTIAAKNTTGNALTLSSFGFDSEIPAGAIINTVNFLAEYHVSTTSGIAFVEFTTALSGTPGTYITDSTEPTLVGVTITVSNMARPGGGSWTRADLLDSVFTVLIRARSGNNATSVTHSWDCLQVYVDYFLDFPLTPISQPRRPLCRVVGY
jgi:hypothetical protein